MQKGFQSLVAAVEDLSLDVPAAAELLAVFISRAIVDEILPPSFVGSLPTGKPDILPVHKFSISAPCVQPVRAAHSSGICAWQ